MTVISLPEQKEALQAYLKKRHQEIGKHQSKGASGEQIVASLTDLADEVIDGIYRQALQSVPPDDRWKLEDGLAIVALGGYGRGELAPYSDIDLMFLHRKSCKFQVQEPAALILQTLWDVGYRVGHSLRTVADCVLLGRQDLTVKTALMEARFLAGSQRLFDRFRLRFHRKVVLKGPSAYIKAKVRNRRKEIAQYGTTIYLLEPNVKLSRGGLRDLHLLRWAALAQHHTGSLETLRQYGILNTREYASLTEAQEFLWHIRNELHFAAGRNQDRLTFEEQIRMAEKRGMHDKNHLLGVEQFMKQYYEHTTAVQDIANHVVSQMLEPPFPLRFIKRLGRRSLGTDFLIEGSELAIRLPARPKVLGHTAEWLGMIHLAQIHEKDLSYETQSLIKNARVLDHLATQIDSEAASVFMMILGRAGRAAWALRELHRQHLLELIIPEFSTARGLMQFNEYHKYTVDEHCLRAVEEAEAYLNQSGTVAQAYGEIKRKDLLHLALLIHDLGKGQGGDHSAIGVQIAEGLEKRLRLSASDKRVLVFLVEQHLLMTRIAFRRDLSDEKVLLQFAKTVTTPERLRMLYILTLADVAAVGPDTLTAWKKDLLGELYSNTLEFLTGEKVEISEAEKVERAKSWVLAHAVPAEKNWVEEQLAVMTSRYLLTTPFEHILGHLQRIRELSSHPVLVDSEFDPGRQTTKYTVFTSDSLTKGIFYKIAGALAAKGLQILGATITTWKNDTVIDTFQVQDTDFSGAPTPRKMEKVKSSIQDVLLNRVPVEDLLVKGWRLPAQERPFPKAVPAQVEVDNSSSERYTIVEVFAQDRQGLLFIMARAMFELGLLVHTAKVSTQLDQIVDVFYVTDQAGSKIMDPEWIQRVRQKITDEIEQFLIESRQRPSLSSGGEGRSV